MRKTGLVTAYVHEIKGGIIRCTDRIGHFFHLEEWKSATPPATDVKVSFVYKLSTATDVLAD